MSTIVERDTVSIYFVTAALARLGPRASARVLLSAGIPAALLSNPQARVPATAFAALWRSVAEDMDDEFFGLDRRRMKSGSFALLCHGLMDCDNLEHALRRALHGMRLFLDDVEGALRVDGAQATLVVTARIADPAARLFAEETFLTLMHGLMCWLVAQRVELDAVAFAAPRPVHSREYTRMFSGQLEFDAPATGIRFAAAALALPLRQNRAGLQRFLASAPQSVFLKFRNEHSWSSRLRRRLRGAVGQARWPGLEQLAQEFDTSASTLRRRLDEEGNSFQTIKSELRNEMAIELLCSTGLSVDDIGATLGFHDASAFHRAFRRWNGVQPGEYRQRSARRDADGGSAPAAPDPEA